MFPNDVMTGCENESLLLRDEVAINEKRLHFVAMYYV